LARLWDDFGSEDAAVAHKAAEALLASPQQAVSLLDRLPELGLTRKKLDRLVTDLDDDVDVRDRASDELKEAGHLAEAALRDGLARGPSLEGKRRIGKLPTNTAACRPATPSRPATWRRRSSTCWASAPTRSSTTPCAGPTPSTAASPSRRCSGSA